MITRSAYCVRCDLAARELDRKARQNGARHPTGQDTEWTSADGAVFACTGCGLTSSSPLSADETELLLDRDEQLSMPRRARYSLL